MGSAKSCLMMLEEEHGVGELLHAYESKVSGDGFRSRGDGALWIVSCGLIYRPSTGFG